MKPMDPTGKSMAGELTVNRWLDWTARAAVVFVFAALVVIGVAVIPRLLPLDSIHKLLMLAASIANVLFLSLVAATAISTLSDLRFGNDRLRCASSRNGRARGRIDG